MLRKKGDSDDSGKGKKKERKPYTKAELAEFNGSDPAKPILLAICGVVFDVSERRDLYGKVGEGYNVFTGRDASQALAKMQLDDAALLNDDVSQLGAGEISTLHEWLFKFRQQYDVVGWVADSASAHLDPAHKNKQGKV